MLPVSASFLEVWNLGTCWVDCAYMNSLPQIFGWVLESLTRFCARKLWIQVAAFSLLGKRAGAALLGGARGRKLVSGCPGILPFDPLRVLLHLYGIDCTVSTLY